MHLFKWKKTNILPWHSEDKTIWMVQSTSCHQVLKYGTKPFIQEVFFVIFCAKHVLGGGISIFMV